MPWTPEYTRQYMKEYRKRNKAKIAAQVKAWKAAHPESDKRYYQQNKDILQAKRREYNRKRYQNDPIVRNKAKSKSREQYRRLREQVRELFGGACVNCGYSGVAWELDHKKDNGYLERRELTQAQIYRRSLRHPEDYQILCGTCNKEKRLAKVY